MTGLLKCVVFSCAVSLVYGLTNVRDDVNWFKNGERIKNRFVTGVVNGIVDFNCNDNVKGESSEGECLSKVECTKIGGRTGGLCSLLGSCCVIEKTCDQSTSSKLSYFVPPSNFTQNCPLTVNVYSKDVCQIRLDFEKFDISQPTTKLTRNEGTEFYEAFKCRDDAFTVENTQKNLGFVHLCGRNEKQHIYIPIGKGQQNVVLRFVLRQRNEAILPEWRIKIRQLECRRSGYEHILTAPSKLMAMYNTLKNKKNPKSDYDWIAPPNCLQYYPNSTGTFESFNYNGGKGCYIGNLHYAICFKKTPDICQASYKADGEFQMNANREVLNDHCHPSVASSPKISQDYIQIPGGINSEDLHGDYYCNTDFDNNTVTAKTFGPLYVGVHTDGYRPFLNDVPRIRNQETDNQEIGFRIRYELQSGTCNTEF